MKKLLLFITGILAIGAFLSCSGDEPKMTGQDADSSVREPFSTNTNLRTLEEAAAIVRANMGLLGETGSRSAACRSFNPSSAKMVVNYGKSRAQLPDTLMYVFNFDNDEGFAIVAADRRLEGLIAITEKGSYDPAVGTDNPGLQYYMTVAKENLQLRLDSIDGVPLNDTIGHVGLIPGAGGDVISEGDTTNNGDDPNSHLAQYKFVRDTIEYILIKPEMLLWWGQHYPEAMLTEDKVLGCGNTACLIAMGDLRKPQTMTLTQPGQEGRVLEINWNIMSLHNQSFDSEDGLFFDFCHNKFDNHEKLALIGYELFLRNDSRKVPANSNPSGGIGYSVEPNKIISTLNDLGLEADGQFYFSVQPVLNTLRNKGILIASSKSKNYAMGHIYVIDGMKYYEWWSGEYIKPYGQDWYLANDHGIQYNVLNHINWGWNGYGNGWFTSSVYDPHMPTSLDNNNFEAPSDIDAVFNTPLVITVY